MKPLASRGDILTKTRLKCVLNCLYYNFLSSLPLNLYVNLTNYRMIVLLKVPLNINQLTCAYGLWDEKN